MPRMDEGDAIECVHPKLCVTYDKNSAADDRWF